MAGEHKYGVENARVPTLAQKLRVVVMHTGVLRAEQAGQLSVEAVASSFIWTFRL